MIKPREIRDNILVQLLSPPSPIKLPTGIIKVVKLMGSEFKLYNIDKPVCSQEMGIILDIKMVTGIPITEEWLLKFGFILDLDYKESYDIYANGLNIAYYLNTNEILLNQEDIPNSNEWITLRKKIKYVHQFQNLYFALTGEQLTIKK